MCSVLYGSVAFSYKQLSHSYTTTYLQLKFILQFHWNIPFYLPISYIPSVHILIVCINGTDNSIEMWIQLLIFRDCSYWNISIQNSIFFLWNNTYTITQYSLLLGKFEAKFIFVWNEKNICGWHY